MAPDDIEDVPQMVCPRCSGATIATTVRTAIWRDEQLVVVEDIPARVCQECVEQYYDEDVSDALRLLMERGFPTSEAKKELQVPVFSLEGRIRVRSELPEDTYLD
jgi:YgiT-type zinc finger domain-containing protein